MRASLRDNFQKAKPLLSAVVDTVFPARCASCHASIGAHGAMCSACWSSVHFITDPLCFRCGLPFEHTMASDTLCGECMRKPPAYTEARAVFRYDDHSRSQVLALKYHDKTQLAPVFGQWLARLAAPYTGKVQAIVPVPLHYWRLLSRRYNQAALLAHQLSLQTGIPVLTNALHRTRATQSQSGLSRTGREENVRGAFKVAKDRKDLLKAASVLLIDDVMTTGATLNACARALHDAGVADVFVLTLARTLSRIKIVKSLPLRSTDLRGEPDASRLKTRPADRVSFSTLRPGTTMTNTWLFFALGSAFFAAMTAILGKLGVSEINSNMATLIRTLVILLMTLGIVLARSEWQPFGKLSRFGMTMLVLSGIATGLSWLCYYRALQLGDASKVAPVDKLSVVLVILFAVLFLGEPLSWKTALGGALVTAGAVLIAL